jgi:hypothetical protein
MDGGEFGALWKSRLGQSGECYYPEDLAREGAYEFCYVCMTNKIRGTTAGFTLRPIALR